MSQNSLILPTTGIVTGLQMTQYTNQAFDTLKTLASGTAAPASIEAGQLWHDTTLNILKIRSLDNTAWVPLLVLNESTYAARPYSPESFSRGGYVNRIQNAGLSVWQRGTAGTVVRTASEYYRMTADRWAIADDSVTLSWAQAPLNAASLYGLKVTGNTGASGTYIYQRLAAVDASVFAGQTITIQAAIYNGTGATITPQLTTGFPASTDTWTGQTADLNFTNLQPCPNGTTTVVSYTFTTSSSASLGYYITFYFGNYLGSSSKYVIISQIDARVTPDLPAGQLTSSPPTPELRGHAAEVVECQQHFWRPAIASASNSLYWFGSGRWFNSTTAEVYIPFPATMRAIPAVTFEGSSGQYYITTGGGLSAAAATSISASAISTQGAQLYAGYSTGGQTAGIFSALLAGNQTTNSITFSAEL